MRLFSQLLDEPSNDLKVNRPVFWIPFGFLVAASLFSIFDKRGFFQKIGLINDWILSHFSQIFSWTTFGCLLVVAIAYFSPLSRTVIGGSSSVPFLNKWRWFSITLCTTIATGILFWASAEPIFHLHEPPTGFSTEDYKENVSFAMSSMFLHWTLSPYSIYTALGLLFALSYYNAKSKFSLGSLLTPLFGSSLPSWAADILNGVCLFALVSGMAASLGSGLLAISGGLHRLLDIPNSSLVLGIIASLIVLAFVISAGSGLMRGIRILSSYNTIGFILLAAFIFTMGFPKESILIGWDGLIEYGKTFVVRSLDLSSKIDEPWQQQWSSFYWANWMAWAPISALFLGRLAYGYTVREFIHMNLLVTAIFSAGWMIIFSGSVLHLDTIGSSPVVYESLVSQGPESAIYVLFSELPSADMVSLFFLLLVFISFVTAADSNTSAMSAICTSGISPDNAEAPVLIKIGWGLLIGAISWTMVSYSGIEGIKTISILGGFPTLFLTILVLAGLVRLIIFPQIFSDIVEHK